MNNSSLQTVLRIYQIVPLLALAASMIGLCLLMVSSET